MDLNVNNSYLIQDKDSSKSNPRKLTVLSITQTSYKIRWENYYELWYTQKSFNEQFSILEDLGMNPYSYNTETHTQDETIR